jgi:hypothetical protein
MTAPSGNCPLVAPGPGATGAAFGLVGSAEGGGGPRAAFADWFGSSVSCLGAPALGPVAFGSVDPAAFSRAVPEPPACPGPPGPPVPALDGPTGDPGAGGAAGGGVGQPFGPHEVEEPPAGAPGVGLCAFAPSTDRSHPGPPAPHTEASTALVVGWAGLGAPVIRGAVELSVAGTVFGAVPHGPPVVPHALCGAVAPPGAGGLGVPVPGGVVVSAAAGWAGFGVAALWAAVLVLAAGWAGLGDPFCGAVLALDADGAGFDAGFGASELPPLDPLEAELEDAADLGAGELPELEPLSEDDFAAAGFGAGELPPEPPEGPPATLATVRTATVEDASPGVGTAEVVLVCVEESRAASIHTSATAPRSTDTDPGPAQPDHHRNQHPNRNRSRHGQHRDQGCDARAPPTSRGHRHHHECSAGCTDTATVSPAWSPGFRRPGAQKAAPSRMAIPQGGFPGLAGTQLRPNRQPRSHHTEGPPQARSTQVIGTGARHDLSDADQDYRDRHPSQPNFGKSQ